MLPYFDVSHLPSSASFYSAVLQPLGLQYLSSGSGTLGEPNPSSSSSSSASAPAQGPTTATAVSHLVNQAPVITFGVASQDSPVFQIRQAQSSSLKRSHATLSAPTSVAAIDFRTLALRADPAGFLQLQGQPDAYTIVTPDGSGETRSRITDLDGNIMDVVYQPPPSHHYAAGSAVGSSVSRKHSAQEEPGRIVSWNYDFGTPGPGSKARPDAGTVVGVPSETASAVSSKLASNHDNDNDNDEEEPWTLLRRTVTRTFTTPATQPNSGTSTSDNTNIVGAILGAAAGAAAGAALTYGMMRGERGHAPTQQFIPPPPSSAERQMPAYQTTHPPPHHQFQRRSTFPENYPDQPRGGRYVEVERTVEKIRYPDEYALLADHKSPPRYLAKYSQSNISPRPMAIDDMYDDKRYRRSSRARGSGSSVRSRSEAPSAAHAPLMIMNHEHRSSAGSHVGSRHSTKPPSHHGKSRDADNETYVSARSKRSTSTVRGPPPPTVETELAPQSRSSSRAPSLILGKAASVRAPSKAPSSKTPSVKVPDERAPSVNAPTIREPSIVSIRGASAHGPPSKAPSQASKSGSRPGGGPAVSMTGDDGPIYSVPPNASRTPSHVSARNIGLPGSEVGSSRAGWDDDHVSVAPSDSISCAGSKTSRRKYNL